MALEVIFLIVTNIRRGYSIVEIVEITEDSVGVRKASTWCIGFCHDLGHASRCGHFLNDIDFRRSGRGRESS